jgi:signal transduction histidine kinase
VKPHLLDRLSLRTKLTAIMCLTLAVSLGLAYAVLMFLVREYARSVVERRLSILASVIDVNAQAPLAFVDAAAADATLGSLRADDAVLAAWVQGRDGKIFSSYRSPRFTEPFATLDEGNHGLTTDGDQVRIVRPMVANEDRLGTLAIVSDLSGANAVLHRYAWIIALVMGGSSVCATLLWARLQSGIMTRLSRLSQTVDYVAVHSDFGARAQAGGADEVGQLISGFNRMLDEIQQRHAEVGKRTDELAALNAELDARVTERTAELNASNKELEAFSYSVAHDLRAPLRHIDGFADLLARHLDKSLDDKGRRYLNTIGAAAKDMGLLVDHLLVYSRMGKTELKKTETPLDPLVAEVRQVVDRGQDGRSITWNVEALPAVVVDPEMMRQVFTNLLSNAVKYTRNVAEAVIEVRCRAVESDQWEFTVSDNGAGFDMQFADKLFGVFQRLHSTSEFEGTGIGLANVRRIIARHGGRTWAVGTVNQGASFHFTLPRSKG